MMMMMIMMIYFTLVFRTLKMEKCVVETSL